jgi:hypothetical protein
MKPILSLIYFIHAESKNITQKYSKLTELRSKN